MLVVGVPGFLFYVVFVPAALARTLIHQRRSNTLYYWQDWYNPKWTLRYGFVFAGYRPGYEWWESVILFRKCCFVMLGIYLGAYDGATPQCVASSMVLSAALSLQLQYRPFLHEEHNRLESIGLHVCLMQLLVK